MQKKHVEAHEDNEEIKKKVNIKRKEESTEGKLFPNIVEDLQNKKQIEKGSQEKQLTDIENKANSKKSKVKKSPNLLKHLPKISAVNYQGKEICKNCNKHISKTQKSVLLAGGERKIHFKCRNRETSEIPIHSPETSNIVEDDPSPKVNETCLNCKLAARKMQSVVCSTCKGWCHLNCSATMEAITLKQSFEWLCPNPTCAPNHYAADEDQILPVTNRFSTLKRCKNNQVNHISKNKVKERKANSAKKQKSVTTEVNLSKVLTQIKVQDYIGKETCYTCYKHLSKNSRATKCKFCKQWSHIKCSDLKPKEYLQVKHSKREWSCLSCRISEMEVEEYFDKKKCSANQLPDEWDQIKAEKGKDEEIILHFNARSLTAKEDSLTDIANKIKPAAIFITESWLDDSCPKGTAVPDNYTVIRHDRSLEFKQKYGKKNGGGVAVMVRKGVNIQMETSLTTPQNEILWCTLKTLSTKYLIGIIYRASYTTLLSADSEGNTDMEDLLQKTLHHNLIIIGDLNCDISSPEPDQETKKLINLANEYELKQLIDKPTRFSDSASTTIDHIWIRDTSLIRKAGTCEGLSDHCGVYAYIKTNSNNKEPEEVRCRSFKSFDEDTYREDIKSMLKASNFKKAIDNKDVNKAFNIWLHILKTAADKHAPWKTFKRKYDQAHIPWHTKEIDNATKVKNIYLKLYQMYRKPEDKKLYKIAKNKQTHLKRKLKREYYKNKITEYDGESSKMWSVLKDITHLNYKEEIMPDVVNKDTANRFNNFFANVGKTVQDALNINISQPKLNTKGIFKFEPETPEKIKYLINRIKPDVATGHDELSSRLIKAAGSAILEDLSTLINLSYETNTFPDQLKRARIKALHKKGGNNEPSQYRPIAILTIISKVFERSAVEQITQYYDTNQLLNSRQHAYRKLHSTTTSLFEMIETAQKHFDQGYLVGVASMDLSKAFDSLNHNLILKKLTDMGLNETAVMWIQSYLRDRIQTVKFDCYESDESTVESGVPQGSILGPLLFITCTNDLVLELNEYDIFTYADDMQILIKGRLVEELSLKLESAIEKANLYYRNNSLMCNPTKTEIMLMGTKKRLSKTGKLRVKVSSGNEVKELVGEKYLKVLGVLIDQSLTWDQQTSKMKQKATNSIRNLHRINDLVPRKQQRILYNSLVAPHFSYADIVWNNCGKANEKKLQLAQNFAAKSMLGMRKYDSATTALKKLELLPLAEKRKISIAVHVKKSLVAKAPNNIQNLFMKQLSYEDTRAAVRGDLNYPKHRTQQYQHSPLYTAIKTWNQIPIDLRDNNLTTFKTQLQKQMTKKYITV